MQVLYSLVVLVPLLLGFLKSTEALPSPDFGVNATVHPARLEVENEASRLLAEFNAVSAVSVTLTSDTSILLQMQSAIVSIANKFRTSGATLTQRLVTLATNNGPSISGVFNPVYGSIEALKDLTINGLSEEMTSIAQVVPTFVTQKFSEVFADLRRALDLLTSKLQVLERDVTRARTAAGNAPHISDTIIRNNVPVKAQGDVTRALIALRLKIDPVRYMVRSTLSYLLNVDEFLLDMVDQVNAFNDGLTDTFLQFSFKMNGLMQTTVQYANRSFACGLNEQKVPLMQMLPALNAIPNFSTTLQQPLEDLLAQLSPDSLSSSMNAFVGQFNNYITDIGTDTTAIVDYLQGVTCNLVRKLVLTLISFGPQNVYCFNRNSAHVYGLYELHLNLVTKCYEAEFDRLSTMVQFLQNAVDVLLYDVEDLADNVSVCVTLTEDRSTCVEQYGLRYTAVLNVYTMMLNDAGNLFTEEFATSYARFGVCVASSQQLTLDAIAKIDQRLGTCHQQN